MPKMTSNQEYKRYSLISGDYFFEEEKDEKWSGQDRAFESACRYYRKINKIRPKGKSEREEERDIALRLGLDGIADFESEIDRKWESESPEKRLVKAIRSRVKGFVNGGYDDFEKHIGCDRGTFKKHIESQFEDGMSWDNWGDWHLDHIIPVSAYDFCDDREISKCCNYRNFRPLWAGENIIKGGRIENRLIKRFEIEHLLPA